MKNGSLSSISWRARISALRPPVSNVQKRMSPPGLCFTAESAAGSPGTEINEKERPEFVGTLQQTAAINITLEQCVEESLAL